MKSTLFIAMAVSGLMFFSCGEDKIGDEMPEMAESTTDDFQYQIDQFADLKILRHQRSREASHNR